MIECRKLLKVHRIAEGRKCSILPSVFFYLQSFPTFSHSTFGNILPSVIFYLQSFYVRSFSTFSHSTFGYSTFGHGFICTVSSIVHVLDLTSKLSRHESMNCTIQKTMQALQEKILCPLSHL
jgi:hypothetical protein